MEKLASIRAFTKVVQHNSFAAAARDLRLSRSAVSKHVIELEEERGRVEQKNGVTNARQKWRDAPLTKKAPYEPDAGNRHVRFDERGWETERCRMAQATAPILDSTLASFTAVHKISTRSEVLRT
jgi:hypothetical protein